MSPRVKRALILGLLVFVVILVLEVVVYPLTGIDSFWMRLGMAMIAAGGISWLMRRLAPEP